MKVLVHNGDHDSAVRVLIGLSSELYS